MLYKEKIVAVCSDIRAKRINILCGKNVDFEYGCIWWFILETLDVEELRMEFEFNFLRAGSTELERPKVPSSREPMCVVYADA
jgi:NADPH-dependent glutamate synthase beta subunit-like oxidoreductase